MDVVGEAGDAASAVQQCRTLQPDVVLMDIDLPGGGGIGATRQIMSDCPGVLVVMLTVIDDSDTLVEAIKAGAQGYIVKNVRSNELLDQLRGLAQGEAAISRRMASRLLEEFRQGGARSTPDVDLTPREREILELVAAHHSNKEIAARLVISEFTVKNHLKNILSKLNVRSRGQAAAYSMARGWIRRTE
jgi:two-component system, NarL family, nitrate/nitrite response regulator NarL